jgi:hypothetical protein
VGAPLFAAYIFDTRGSYTVAILVLAGLGAFGALLFIFATEPALPPGTEHPPVY